MPRRTQLYDRRREEVGLDEVERIVIRWLSLMLRRLSDTGPFRHRLLTPGRHPKPKPTAAVPIEPI
jgi:hypothetical protein